jgi:pilus assembly protein CpaD
MARHSASVAAALALAATLAAPAAARKHVQDPANNRQLSSAHQPVVSRADYTFDAVAGPSGLAPGEAQRLAGWFDGLTLGYGDTVTLAEPGGWHGDPAASTVSAVLSRYGMLLAAEGAPASAGHPPAGSVRVVVSRAVARVEDCPDYSNGNQPDYARHTLSNYGCATAGNLAAMIANPQDLVRGHEAGPATDPRISTKAVAAWRDADPTGKGGLKSENTRQSAGGGGGN